MFCNLEQRDGKWYCINCNGRPLRGNYKRVCKANNGNPPKPAYVDPVRWMTSRYSGLNGEGESSLKGLLAKLDRCLSADCELLVDDVCTRCRGSACKHHERWFERLLLIGKCEHWKPIVDLARPFS